MQTDKTDGIKPFEFQTAFDDVDIEPGDAVAYWLDTYGDDYRLSFCDLRRPRPLVANDNDPYGPIDPWARAKHPTLPLGILPKVIEKFAFIQGDIMGVDAGGLATAALAVCAAAIPDRIDIQVKAHDPHWTESARLWVALVGNPSAKKSPTIGMAAAPIKRIDGEMFAAWVHAMAEYEALPKEDRAATPAPRQPRLRLEDVTMEAAQEVLRDSPDGVLCLQDELSGWFGGMEKYTTGKGAAKDRGFWLQSFNGGSFALNRVGRGSMLIENLSISLLGGIQPDPIRRIATDMTDDGLLQRLFPVVMAESRVGKDVPVPPVIAEYEEAVRRLHMMKRPTVGLMDVPLRFDDRAQALRSELEHRHFRMVCQWEGINKKLAAHFGKYDGLFARLCVIFHCLETTADKPPSIVPFDTARRAAWFLHRFLRPHAIAFYTDVIGLSDRHDAVLATAGYILSHGLETITARDVQRGDRIMRSLSRPETEETLAVLDAYGWLVPAPSLRRDSVTYEVVPAVHSAFEERAAIEAERRSTIQQTIRAVVA